MDPIQLASMTGDFLAALLLIEDEVDLCSVLRPDNVIIAQQRIQLREMMPTATFVPVSGFAAPEQYVAGNCERAPVYFIGALMYTLLYGKPPTDVRKRLSDGESVDMSTTVLSDVITRCLMLYPGDRYANLRQILSELNDILNEVAAKEKEETEEIKKEQNDEILLQNPAEYLPEIKADILPQNEIKGQNKSDLNENIVPEITEINEGKIRKKGMQKKWILPICSGVLICILLGYTLWQSQRTEMALEQGEYNQVVSYLNWTPWLKLFHNDIYLYATAQMLWEEGRYDEAQDIFVEIQDYANSAQLIEQIQYDKGMSLANALQLEEAKLVFDSLGTFADSAAQSAKITTYQQALAIEDASEKYLAFTELGDYLNSPQMAEEAAAETYHLATTNYEAENLAEAGRLFGVVGNYQDAVIYKHLCDLWQAASDDADENRTALGAIMAYGEVANLEPVVMNDRFFMIFLEGNWVSADGGGEMSFEEDTFRAPLLDVVGTDWSFDTRSIHNEDEIEATFDYLSPNDITMKIEETGETFTYQRVV